MRGWRERSKSKDRGNEPPSKRRRREIKKKSPNPRLFRVHDSSISISTRRTQGSIGVHPRIGTVVDARARAGREESRVFENQQTGRRRQNRFPLSLLLPRHGPGDLVSALRRKGRGVEELVKLLVEVGGGTVRLM